MAGDCKSPGLAYVGSSPTRPTRTRIIRVLPAIVPAGSPLQKGNNAERILRRNTGNNR